jgi:transposase InsO family protein
VGVCEDLVDRAFAADGPDRLWVADITYLRTWEGWLYLAAVQDVFSRRIVGRSMAEHMRTELVPDVPCSGACAPSAPRLSPRRRGSYLPPPSPDADTRSVAGTWLTCLSRSVPWTTLASSASR